MELVAENLACARGGILVLERLSFRLAPSQALVLRGPNGAGKTTLLRVIAGLQPASEGRLSAVDGTIAYAGHADGVKSALTVVENLQFWAEVHGQRGVETAMAEMNLLALQDRPAGTLSAGQRRRLGLARLLVTGRQIWALDEPTVSLDAASVALFAGVVAAHLGAGGSALIATHVDLGLAQAETLDLTPFRARAPKVAPL